MFFIIALIILAVSILVYINTKKTGRLQEAKLSVIGIALGGILALIQIFTVVPAGTVGVVDFLGKIGRAHV